ncbi:P2Y purinoceptor 11 [Emys orbicularis]|uniref:P2Y purinoceptor 11 n=1 Tax=Emys orbicularis TaxID=82168 RepID=UPI0031FC91AA
MGREGKTKNQKRARAAAQQRAQEQFASVPHSFVFHRRRVGRSLQQLVLDVRRVMEPFTASTLQVRKKNSLKDFVAVAGPLGVTHFLVFTKSPTNVNFKLVRLPGGPTLTFKVTQYSLIKDVVSSLKRHRMHEQQFTHHPLLVLNNFGLQQMHVKLMATMFQNMFPSINVHKVNLNAIKRCLLISYNSDSQLLDFRHYSLKVVPVGASKGLKKLLQEKFPNMSRLEDISELLAKDINLSESEAEQDGTHNILELPQAYAGRGNMKAQQSAVRLTEIGPRMTLQLIKVEEGLNQGNVLYHSFILKTEEELRAALARKEERLRLKAERRRRQEADVQRKKEQREAHRKQSLAGIRRKQQQGEDGDSGAEDPGMPEDQDPANQSDDDAEYYRQEVGEEPDADLFPKSTKRKHGPPRSPQPSKRLRTSQPGEQPASRKAKHRRPPGQPQRGGRSPRQQRELGNSQRPGQQKDPRSLKGRGQQRGARSPKPKGPRHPGQQGTKRGVEQRLQTAASCQQEGTPCYCFPLQPAAGPAAPGSQHSARMTATGPEGPGACNVSFNKFQEHMWPVLTVEFFLAFAGNAFAIYRFVARERTWHTGIVYSFNLAVSDLLYALSLPFLAAYYYPPKHWRYGPALCKLERFLFSCNLYGSIFFLTCISLNRYLGIVHPLLVHGRLEPRHAKLLSGAAWLLVAGLSAPTLHFSELQPRGNCTECMGSATNEQLPRYLPYSLFLAAFGCGLPFLLTLFSYAAILRTVCRNPHITRLEKRKVGRLVSVGVALYAVSYLPYHTLRNLNLNLRQQCLLGKAPNYQHALFVHSAYQLSKILVTLNICAHPLLYAALADSMRGWCRAPRGQDRGQSAENMELKACG